MNQKLEHHYNSPYYYYYDGYYHPHNDAFAVVFFFIIIGIFIFSIFWCWGDNSDYSYRRGRGRRPRDHIVYRPIYVHEEPKNDNNAQNTNSNNQTPQPFRDNWNRDEV